jgi:hypothetical protein
VEQTGIQTGGNKNPTSAPTAGPHRFPRTNSHSGWIHASRLSDSDPTARQRPRLEAVTRQSQRPLDSMILSHRDISGARSQLRHERTSVQNYWYHSRVKLVPAPGKIRTDSSAYSRVRCRQAQPEAAPIIGRARRPHRERDGAGAGATAARCSESESWDDASGTMARAAVTRRRRLGYLHQ